jgi:hypothetical protein
MKERRPRINWLRTRFRRQLPYERDARWSQSPDEKRRWTEALEAEGVPAVRRVARPDPHRPVMGDARLRRGVAGLARLAQDQLVKMGVVLALVVAIVGLVRRLVG